MAIPISFAWLTVSESRDPGSAETDELVLHGLDVSARLCIEARGVIAAERASGVIFITGNLIDRSKVRFAAELAQRDRSLLIGLLPGINLCKLSAAENLRSMLHFCDTVIIMDPMEKANSGLIRSRRRVVASAICEGLADSSSQRPLRNMLKRGQLARVGSARSTSNVEEAILKALRAILPVAEFSRNPEVFLNISSPKIDRNILARASKWISKALNPSNTILCSNYRKGTVEANACLLATGMAVPYSPSSRNISMDIDELEPESNSDNEIAMALGLDQMELLENHLNL